MESLNLKIIPVAILALVSSYLTFVTIANLIANVQILFNLESVIRFLASLIVLVSITAFLTSLTLALVNNIYYRVGLFVLLFLPFASVFMLSGNVEPLHMLIFVALFTAMALTIVTEFDRHYANQIRARLDTPARANVRTMAFFLALTAALAFFSLNSSATNQEAITDRIIDDIISSTSDAIQDYGLVERMMGQNETQQVGQTIQLNRIQPQITQLIETQIRSLITPYEPYVIYILTLLVFGTVAGSSTLASFLTTLLSMALLPLLKSAGFVKESKQMVEVTRITL
jgi:hypothetical protein